MSKISDGEIISRVFVYLIAGLHLLITEIIFFPIFSFESLMHRIICKFGEGKQKKEKRVETNCQPHKE